MHFFSLHALVSGDVCGHGGAKFQWVRGEHSTKMHCSSVLNVKRLKRTEKDLKSYLTV